MRRCLKSEKGRRVDWSRLLSHLHRGGDFSLIPVTCISLKMMERSLQVILLFVFFEDGDEIVKIEVVLFIGRVVVILAGLIEIIIAKNVVERNVWNLRLGFTVISFQIV